MIKRVLFLCTGNSCRSQMADGIINHGLAGQIEAASAGTARTHIPFIDPPRAPDSEEEIITTYCRMRGHIRKGLGTFFRQQLQPVKRVS